MSTSTAPRTTMTGPDQMGYRKVHVDGIAVAAISQADSGRLWRCDPGHRHGPMGGCSWVPLGEHLDGCGWVATAGQWHVYPTRSMGAGRYYRTLPDALVEARRLAEQYTRCSRPVAARLCRLVKRHDGPCIPWS